MNDLLALIETLESETREAARPTVPIKVEAADLERLLEAARALHDIRQGSGLSEDDRLLLQEASDCDPAYWEEIVGLVPKLLSLIDRQAAELRELRSPSPAPGLELPDGPLTREQLVADLKTHLANMERYAAEKDFPPPPIESVGPVHEPMITCIRRLASGQVCLVSQRYFRAIIAELEAAPAYPKLIEWRDIETAPKDGTPVLLWDECEYIGRWSPTGKGWIGAFHITPTHWQPLPQPPEVKHETQEG